MPPSTVRRTRWLAPESPRSAMTGLQITPPLPAHVIVPNVRVKISEKPEFSRNSRAMGREGTCMDYKTHWVSNSRKPKSTQPKRVPAACLSYTEMCIFGHICPPISRKPEFSRHSGACGLRVPPFYCKTH